MYTHRPFGAVKRILFTDFPAVSLLLEGLHSTWGVPHNINNQPHKLGFSSLTLSDKHVKHCCALTVLLYSTLLVSCNCGSLACPCKTASVSLAWRQTPPPASLAADRWWSACSGCLHERSCARPSYGLESTSWFGV